jgi:hypothetical protein
MAAKETLEDMIRSSAKALGLQVEAEWLPSVRGHLEVSLAHGKSVTDFKLADDAEPAPVFRA